MLKDFADSHFLDRCVQKEKREFSHTVSNKMTPIVLPAFTSSTVIKIIQNGICYAVNCVSTLHSFQPLPALTIVNTAYKG